MLYFFVICHIGTSLIQMIGREARIYIYICEVNSEIKEIMCIRDMYSNCSWNNELNL